MRYCGVTHSRKNKKVYYFRLPERFGDVKRGENVLCNTRIGYTFGKVKTIIEAESDDDFRNIFGINKEISDIVAVGVDVVRLDRIRISNLWRSTRPSRDKLIRRIYEYNKHKAFDTKIIIAEEDGRLLDGYSAYLAAEYLGLDYLFPCVIVKGEEVLDKEVYDE